MTEFATPDVKNIITSKIKCKMRINFILIHQETPLELLNSSLKEKKFLKI